MKHPLSIAKAFTDFRRDVRQKIEQIYEEQESLSAIEIDNEELQDLVESYDEDFSKPYLDILTEEIEIFKNQNS
jgi:uncharacterized protein Veg